MTDGLADRVVGSDDLPRPLVLVGEGLPELPLSDTATVSGDHL
jgi:hypothetical protein